MTTYSGDTARSAPAVTRQPWRSGLDWSALVLGAYLALAPLWTGDAPAGWFVTLGVLIAAVALWALGTVSSPASEWTQIVLGAVTFLAPWIGGFAGVAAAAWTAWVIGVAVVVLAAVAMSNAKRATA